MFRVLKRFPIAYSLETAVSSTSVGQSLVSSPTFLNWTSNGNCGFCTTSSPVKRHATSSLWKSAIKGRGGIVSPLDADKSLLSSGITTVILEHSRSYWGKEGRIGWRRKRTKMHVQREKILNPSSPVIDDMYPWPKDDSESLPSELFGEKIEEYAPAELRNAQNALVSNINNQINSHTEGRLFAVVHMNGKQFKITPEDIIIVQGNFAPTTGDQLRLHKVLLIGSKDFTLLGCPLIDNDLVRIEATVIEKTLSYTKLNFKMKKRENYRRLSFFKTSYTMLRINLIELMQPLDMIQSESETADQRSSVV